MARDETIKAIQAALAHNPDVDLHRHPVQIDHDGEIADAVRLALEKDPSVPRGQIDVTVDHGRVRLAGAVDSEEQSRLAALDCWYVPRVTGVDDGLAVETP